MEICRWKRWLGFEEELKLEYFYCCSLILMFAQPACNSDAELNWISSGQTREWERDGNGAGGSTKQLLEMLRLGRTIKPEANEAKCGYEPFSHLAKTTKSQMEIEVQCRAGAAEGGGGGSALECFNNLSLGNRQFNKPAGQNNCQPRDTGTHTSNIGDSPIDARETCKVTEQRNTMCRN